jgi:hypothetical protein
MADLRPDVTGTHTALRSLAPNSFESIPIER